MRKKGTKNTVYSPEFKIAAVERMRNEQLSYREATVLLGISAVPANGMNRLKLWERIYLEEGAEGLMRERRGRTSKAENPNVGRPPKLEKSAEEDLIAENQRLRMENAYLKKLHALALSKQKARSENEPE